MAYLAGAVMGFINFFIKPVVKLFPSADLADTRIFHDYINILMLDLVAHIVPALVIETWTAAFWAVIIIVA